MPYSPDSPPDVVRHLPKKKQRQWCEVWNSCHDKGQSEEQCFKTAWGVVKKSSCDCQTYGPAESEGSIADATLNRDLLKQDACVAQELVRIAHVLGPINRRMAVSLIQEAKALKLKARIMDFYNEVKRFKGELNDTVQDVTSSVQNPKALAAFPEFKDVLELVKILNQGVLRGAHMPESEITSKMEKVVSLDAG